MRGLHRRLETRLVPHLGRRNHMLLRTMRRGRGRDHSQEAACAGQGAQAYVKGVPVPDYLARRIATRLRQLRQRLGTLATRRLTTTRTASLGQLVLAPLDP